MFLYKDEFVQLEADLKMVLCTLFDSNYLDKGLVMFDSLINTTANFKLYVLSMDELCFKVLNEINDERLIPISLYEFEDDELKEIKKRRTKAEYCWTCSSCLIEYVLMNYKEDICTYIDADLFFYSDPEVLINELGDKEVQIVEHRFENTIAGRASARASGRYCVEFNTFKKSAKSMQLLTWWKNQCLNNCEIIDVRKNVAGDQGYLKDWGSYEYVQVLKNLGGGVAPWNIGQYSFIGTYNGKIILAEKRTDCQFDLVFYHFHNIDYLEKNKVDIYVYRNNWKVDDRLVRELYLPYLKKLNEKKQFIYEKYGFYPYITKHPGISRNRRKIKEVFSLNFEKIYLGLRKYIIKCRQASKDIIEFY